MAVRVAVSGRTLGISASAKPQLEDPSSSQHPGVEMMTAEMAVDQRMQHRRAAVIIIQLSGSQFLG